MAASWHASRVGTITNYDVRGAAIEPAQVLGLASCAILQPATSRDSSLRAVSLALSWQGYNHSEKWCGHECGPGAEDLDWMHVLTTRQYPPQRTQGTSRVTAGPEIHIRRSLCSAQLPAARRGAASGGHGAGHWCAICLQSSARMLEPLCHKCWSRSAIKRTYVGRDNARGFMLHAACNLRSIQHRHTTNELCLRP